MRVRRTRQAEQDLIQVWRHIARDDPKAADRVLDELERRSNLLSWYPEIGRKRPDIALDLRYVPSGNYLILHRVVEQHVEVVRYVHGRRNLRQVI